MLANRLSILEYATPRVPVSRAAVGSFVFAVVSGPVALAVSYYIHATGDGTDLQSRTARVVFAFCAASALLALVVEWHIRRMETNGVPLAGRRFARTALFISIGWLILFFVALWPLFVFGWQRADYP